MTQILRGKPIAEKIIERVSATCAASSLRPGLAVVQVGDDSASQIYVKKKVEMTHGLGWHSQHIHLEERSPLEQVFDVIDRLNTDTTIHGILVQLPLPKHLNSFEILERISPDKDVDGFHPINAGRLMQGLPVLAPPCTPYGVMALFSFYGIALKGKKVLVIGRSNIVGKPMVALLIQADATVLWAHSHSQNVPELARSADIIISATGVPKMVNKSFVTPDSILVDVGIVKVDGKVVGDVDVQSVEGHVAARSPVPGGVGPLTIAVLMRNVASLALRKSIDILSITST